MNSLEHLTREVETIIDSELTVNEKLRAICNLLRARVSRYDWVGFYLVDKTKLNELLLGPFDGEPTEHARIPFGKGICGQAAHRRKTIVAQDISQESNYLSCSPNVKSEMVVPIFKNGIVVGELDIDSHTLSAFTSEDESVLQRICEIISRIL
ncbi:MAG: GAF domain-containing protein [Candidatus Bathyarchaeota archaeon]|nr:MAG: GAF domain-containing protein [Candidatus Bathyarchaeota archaeon]